MKEKEEDEERNENICPQTNREQTIKQRTENSNTEATLILCGSSGERANITIRSCTYRHMEANHCMGFYSP